MENTIPTPTKKVRALPRVWARFFRLKAGDTFFMPNDEPRVATKTGPFWYLDENASLFFIAPWRRLKTTVFVRDVLKGGASMNPNDPTISSARRLSNLKPFRASDYQRGPVQTSSTVESGPSA